MYNTILNRKLKFLTNEYFVFLKIFYKNIIFNIVLIINNVLNV